jgi:hypothetical protein
MKRRRLVYSALALTLVILGVRFLMLIRSPGVYEKIALSGLPVVQAAETYRAAHGLFPIELRDVVPKYLTVAPDKEWQFGPGSVFCYPSWPSVGISYHFPTDSPIGAGGWWVYGEGVNRQLDVPHPTPSTRYLAGEPLFTAQLSEYERRISRFPTERMWYADKISFLASVKHDQALRNECERTANLFPNWWFPQIVLAQIGGFDTAATARFKGWVESNPRFVTYWYLARHFRDKGDIEGALNALEKAANCPFEGYPEDSAWTGTGLAFDAANFTYENKHYELTLKLCQQWATLGESHGEQSWLAFQAAAELAQGQFESAAARAGEALQASRKKPMAAMNLPILLQAAEAHDTNFIYQPGTPGVRWELFTPPRP